MDLAIDIADSHGVHAVSLREVARVANLDLATVQRSFSNRDRLVTAMAHHVMHRQSSHTAQSSDEVHDVLRQAAEDRWVLYQEHPWLVSVLATTRPPLDDVALRQAGKVITALMDLGRDPAEAFANYLTLNAYVQGMALLLHAEHQQDAVSAVNYQSWWTSELRRLRATGAHRRHPWFDERATAFDQHPEQRIAEWFSTGLHTILDALTESTPNRPAPRHHD